LVSCRGVYLAWLIEKIKPFLKISNSRDLRFSMIIIFIILEWTLEQKRLYDNPILTSD